jgi:acetoin utilization deacetylase AcuC-like enzyme
MRAFYHADQALHDPQQYMRFGRLVSAKDLPARTERLLAVLDEHGIVPEKSVKCGIGPALKIRTLYYLHFLQTVWDRWALLPDHGPEVWPNTFPYYSGRVEADARPPCPATGIVGQIGWFLGDLSVPMGPQTWVSSLRSCETAISAADALLSGEPTVYALCRPSGHHARTDRASGFCYLNNAAVAAQHLHQRYGKVAIVDVDAHHGDGTQQIFYNRGDVLTISVHADPDNYYPFFTGYSGEIGRGEGEGANLNIPLPHGSSGPVMIPAIERAAASVRAFGAEALVFALGYDAHKDDPIGVLRLESDDFGDIGRQVKALGLPTLVVQEGGYAVDAIGGCLSAFLDGLAGC